MLESLAGEGEEEEEEEDDNGGVWINLSGGEEDAKGE